MGTEGDVGGGFGGVLSTIGGFFGPIGGAIGGLLGGLFGGGKGKGQTANNPVYVRDVNAGDLMTELLNITKSQLAAGGAGGMNSINAMLRSQAQRYGAS
jgi:hypothetical protein